ncbi:unnamed protein product, partial [Prunus brigantina]
MGFRDLEVFNKALMAKQCWRLITNEQSMVHKVLKARYFSNCNFLAVGKGRASSYVWRSLIWGHELLLSGLRKRIGDGQETLVYGDAWIPKPNYFRPISPQVLDQETKSPPPVGKYKLNVDSAYIPETSVGGIGAVIRNDKGEVMAAMALPLATATSPKYAEIMALHFKMNFAQDASFSSNLIEFDSQGVVNEVKKDEEESWAS